MKSNFYLLLLSVAVVLYSCNKETFREETSVEVNLLGIEIETSEPSDTESRAATSASILENESQELAHIPFDQHFGVTVSLARDFPNTDGRSDLVKEENTVSRAAGVTNLGPITWKMEDGIQYRLLAYDSNESKVIDTVYTVGKYGNSALKLNPETTYTFVLYSTMSKSEVPAAPNGKLSEAVFTNINGNTDFVYFRKTFKLSPGQNKLNVTLRHVFSQITTHINTADVGNISTIKARIGDHFLSPTIGLNNGTVLTYNNKAENGKVLEFVQNTPTSAANEASIICNSGATKSTLTFDELTINNITKRGVTIPNVQLAPGTRYILTLKIKTFTQDVDPGIELGDRTYAPGNLIYDRNKKTYLFSTKGEGDLWFKNYVKPRRNDLDKLPWGQNNQEARTELNGGPGDPCALVAPLNSWRLPKRVEMENIKNATEANISGHPGPDIYHPVRYIAQKYPGGDRRGMYFGTQTDPGSNFNKFLFISFDGIYNSNTTRSDLDGTGWYMLKNGNKYEYMQIGPNINTFNFYELGQNTAVSIRCVRAN
ncbi:MULTISPECIES: hypothetical protein [Sphingobacterium]|uniref:Fibrobacter succinogenes major paralogous domain-containing protein n=1 Tax=Sphingobacterium populi TaxID=1812824 RepID=A0ABW5UBN9_9SPHI|nr:hypothetical protein [Sphingobacterium sp. CFCC 11742]